MSSRPHDFADPRRGPEHPSGRRVSARSAISLLALVAVIVSGSCGEGATSPPSAPTITSVSPAQVMVGTTTPLVITGTGFIPGETSISVNGGGVIVSGVAAMSATQATATISFEPSAVSGPRELRVETAAGISDAHALVILRNPTPDGISLAAGGGITDTVRSRVATTLEVLVVDAEGFPVPNVNVTFQRAGDMGSEPFVGVAQPGFFGFAASLTAPTDGAGIARASVMLGSRTGTDHVRFLVTSHPHLVDSVSYAMTPGNVHAVQLSVADTALAIGGSATFTATVRDMHGNLRPEVPVISADGAPLSTGASDGVIEATSYGNGRVIAAFEALRDTSDVAVVPAGELLVSTFGRFIRLGTDLSGRADYLVTNTAGGPRWLSASDSAIYHEGISDLRLRVNDGAGGSRQLIPETLPLQSQEWPAPTTNREWIYFLGRVGHQDYELWRVRPDGADPERITTSSGEFHQDLHPSASPDGTSIAYWRSSPAPGLVVHDLGTDDILELGHQESRFSRWSPRGDWIAFHDLGVLRLVRPDGTDDHAIGDPAAGYQGHISWSSDGTWLVVRRGDRLEIVNVDSGVVIWLPRTSGLETPSWRPSAP